MTPPKNDLPPPAADSAARDPSWPQEKDVDARRREVSDANRHLSDAPRAPGAGPQRQLLTQPPAAYLAPIVNAPAAPAAEEKPWYKFW